MSWTTVAATLTTNQFVYQAKLNTNDTWALHRRKVDAAPIPPQTETWTIQGWRNVSASLSKMNINSSNPGQHHAELY